MGGSDVVCLMCLLFVSVLPAVLRKFVSITTVSCIPGIQQFFSIVQLVHALPGMHSYAAGGGEEGVLPKRRHHGPDVYVCIVYNIMCVSSHGRNK